MTGELCMGQEITRGFYSFDTAHNQEKFENQAECVTLTREVLLSYYYRDNT